MSIKQERRDFIGMTFGAVAVAGAAFSLVAVKKTWDPLPSVRAAGFTTVDLSPMKDGEIRQIEWRKKPIFILKKSKDMKANASRDIVVNDSKYIVVIGLCTHLGCIPEFKSSINRFICPCHAGEFDIDGVNVYGPPPTPLVVPPFKIDGTKLVLGEISPEYEKITQKA